MENPLESAENRLYEEAAETGRERQRREQIRHAEGALEQAFFSVTDRLQPRAISRFVKENPMLSFAGAILASALVGLFVKRRR